LSIKYIDETTGEELIEDTSDKFPIYPVGTEITVRSAYAKPRQYSVLRIAATVEVGPVNDPKGYLTVVWVKPALPLSYKMDIFEKQGKELDARKQQSGWDGLRDNFKTGVYSTVAHPQGVHEFVVLRSDEDEIHLRASDRMQTLIVLERDSVGEIKHYESGDVINLYGGISIELLKVNRGK